MDERKYVKFEVDNPICKRRFHIAFEEGSPKLPEVNILCPHCNVTVYHAANHPQSILVREENLIKSPDGSRPIVSKCDFLRT